MASLHTALRRYVPLTAAILCLGAAPVLAQAASTGDAPAPQVTPAANHTPPDDTPSIKVGATMYVDYTYTAAPQSTDAAGNLYHPSAFNATRGYININGKVSHIVSFRITPDINRVSNGDYEFRVKYTFAQFDLGDWMPKGSWIRFGQNQTPLLDYQEGIYRYRFQGTTFSEREGFTTSSDLGVSFHGVLPHDYGDVQAGLYNGEGYHAPEANNQPSFQIRGTIRPFAQGAANARGLRLTGFYDADHYLKNADKRRALFEVSYEHTYLRTAFDYLDTHDQKLPSLPVTHGKGWSMWVTPRTTVGWEGLIRYDHFEPDTTMSSQLHTRTIVGVSYWFPHTGGPEAAILFDYDHAQYVNLAQPDQKKIAVHALVNF